MEQVKPQPLIEVSRSLARECEKLDLTGAAHTIYNPLIYARDPHEAYLDRYGAPPKKVIFLGMNPGPFGMAQTGVPFGEVQTVREWLGITGTVGTPPRPHPRRPVEGFSCTRSEVSGRRLWGLFRDRYGTPDAFFADHLVANYCPLVFMTESGANTTPDKLPRGHREALFEVCDGHLQRLLEVTGAGTVVGVGRFAAARAGLVVEEIRADARPRVVTILHPSPASPAANRGWGDAVVRTLTEEGVWD